jgi:hypothetical protein
MVNPNPGRRPAAIFPKADHPLTLAYIAGARAATHDAMVQAARLIRELEKRSGCEVDACKLAAEVLIERNET